MKRLFKSLVVVGALCVGFVSCNEKEEEIDNSLRDITLSESSLILKAEDKVDLSDKVSFFPESTTDKELKWTSTNNNFVTVTNGLVTAISEGTATIRVESVNNSTIGKNVTVQVLADEVVIFTVKGEVEGVWPRNAIVNVVDQITIKQGKSLTVEEGVTVIVKEGKVGETDAPIEFFVDGSLYMKGTKEKPILLTVAEHLRKPENKYEGQWAGITGSGIFSEMLFDYVIFEYCGHLLSPNSPSFIAGIQEKVTDAGYPILTDNPQGKVVVRNCVFRFVNNDAMYFMGAQGIVHNNLLYAIGESSGDGVNTKAGVKMDVAYNLFFGVNSNGLKLNSKGEAGDRYQTTVKAYNNTIVNSGWRRTKDIKGGSILIQQNVLATIFNNLVLNCRIRAVAIKLTTPSPDDGADWDSFVGNNFYASGTVEWEGFNPTNNIFTTAYDGYNVITSDMFSNWDTYPALYGANFPLIDKTSLFATAPNAPAVTFVNFNHNTVKYDEDVFNYNWDFHVNDANSPIIAGANDYTPESNFTGKFAPYYSTTGITVGGVVYRSPAPKAQYGAFGIKN